jgi:Zn-dependent peptidase ImmA (M78 family)/transcriptional regulator with XRE-family HTH domain
MKRDILAKRIKEARENRGLSQQELASLMGWKSHASITAIENSNQDIKTWELLKFAEILKVSPESLYSETSLLNATKPVVLWRKISDDSNSVLQEENNIIHHAEDFLLLESLTGSTTLTSKSLPLENCDINSINTRWANLTAEKISRELQLGDYPGALLTKRLEEDFGVLIMTRPLNAGSAACYRKNNISIIVLNENEAPWRQIFSVAHELFHLITWNQALIDAIKNDKVLFQKNERAADAFAAALLMPPQMVDLDIQENQLTYSFLVTLARKYNVSTEAILWRLEYLKIIPHEAVKKTLSDKDFIEIDRSTFKKAVQSSTPLGNRFIRLAYLAYEKGLISQTRLAQMLCVKLRDVQEHLSEKGLYPTHDKEIKTITA